MFVIQPAEALWFGREWQGRGRPLPDGYRYASNTNPETLSPEQIRRLVLPIETAYTQGTLA
jgi:UDP-N-acetylglucosamine 4,6-dehydratase